MGIVRFPEKENEKKAESVVNNQMDKETFQRVLKETRKKYRQLFKNLSKR